MSRIETYAVVNTLCTPPRVMRRFRSAGLAGAVVMGKEARRMNAEAGTDRFRVARLLGDGSPQYINGEVDAAPWVPARVKFFSQEKGYGFLIADGVGEDIFLHASAIPMDMKPSIEKEAAVEVKYAETERGLQAFDCRLPGGGADG